MAIEDTIRELRTSISQVQGRKARAEVEHESALERQSQARAVLKEEFGVETTEEARSVLVRLQAELDDKVESVKADLREAGA